MELAIIVIASVVAAATTCQRIAVAVPLSLVVVGIALSFLPGLPAITVNPKVVLAGALPPPLPPRPCACPRTISVAMSRPSPGWP